MEIYALQEKLAKTKEKEKDLRETIGEMLSVLENMDEVFSNIERAKREWESTFDAVSDLISIHDSDSRIIRVNKAFADKFHTTPKELIGRHCHELFHGAMEPIAKCPHKEVMKTKEKTRLEWEDPTTGMVYDISVYPLLDDKGDVKNIIHVVSDITKLKRAEQELRSLNESLAQTNIQLSHKVQTIEVMHEIDRSVLDLVDRTEILEKVSHMLGQLIPCDGIVILLADNEARSFRFEAGWGGNLSKGETVPFDDIYAAEFLRQRRIAVRTDLNMEDLSPFDRRLYESGVRSDIRVPLFSRDEVAALLYICSHRVAGFIPPQLATLENIASQISVALEHSRLVGDLQELIIGTTISLARAMEAKSPWTKGHSEKVTEYAVKIGIQMGLKENELEDLRLAGLLHDIGKIGTYEALLDKPGKLTQEEFEIVKKHPLEAIKILKPVKVISPILPAILHHHENYDGSGYPSGMKGEEIPLFARILNVADSYEAMTADRPYRQSPGKDYAISELRRCSGTQFDPRITDLFLKALE